MSVKPDYKKIILNRIELDQLESYLSIAKDNIADHAWKDLIDFLERVEKQLDKQNYKHKKEL